MPAGALFFNLTNSDVFKKKELKMHSEKRMNKSPDMGNTPTELEWARRKFEAIGNKGKTDLLIYLAYKTGSELRIIEKGRGKGGIRVMAKNLEFAITHNQQTGTIEISWGNIRGKLPSANTERSHRTLERTTSERTMNPGVKSCVKSYAGKPKPATPKLVDNPGEVKETKGNSTPNAGKYEALPTGDALERVPNIDESGRIMDGSDEVNEMKAAS